MEAQLTQGRVTSFEDGTRNAEASVLTTSESARLSGTMDGRKNRRD
jgi:hypothetical protein